MAMTRRPKVRASIAALIAAMLLTACTGGPDEPDPTHAAEPANDQVADAEPVWTREIREGESPSGWAVDRDRVYRMAWPGAEEDRKAELTALDLATGEDLWTVEHPGVIGDLLVDESGAATAEYAIATMAAVAFAGLLVVIMRSEEVRTMLEDLVRRALTIDV